MKKPPFRRKRTRLRRRAISPWAWLAAAVLSAGRPGRVWANPTGLSVGAGAATTHAAGSQLNVTVSGAAFLNWSTFNIQAGETTTFVQPSANSVVVNAIGDKNPSQIFGSLNANGTVILANANGFYFGPNSFVKVGGSFIATTAPLPPDFGSGATWQFTGMPPLASIVLYGQIQAGEGHSLYLIAEDVENHGTLAAPGGSVGLYAGESVLVSDSADGRGLSATVKIPAGAVNNLGKVTADAGSIALQAQVVNQNGILQANSVQGVNGAIELVAGGALTLGADSSISARGGGSAGGSAGGSVTLKAGGTFSDSTGSQISTAGGAAGGDGGTIEVSAPNFASLNTSLDASAQAGWQAGTFLLDPGSIVLSTTGADSIPGNGTEPYNDNNGSGTGGALDLNVNTAFKNFSQIILEATGDITLNSAWNLSTTTGEKAGNLTMEAGGSILFNNGAQLKDAYNWSVTLDAGYNFTKNAVQAGVGTGSDSIFLGGATLKTDAKGNPILDKNGEDVYTPLTGAGSILTAVGSIQMTAGQDILLGGAGGAGSYVNTSGGGSITLWALAGDINAGKANAYPQGYGSVYHSGINTYAGGNVTLTAGHDIISNPSYGQQPAGSSGAYGPGDVTLTAGDAVEGYFQVTSGTGTILAGIGTTDGQTPQILNPNALGAGSSALPLTLSLTTGSWNVWSASDVFIEEARNLSGTFDWSDSAPYSYGSTAALNVWADNNITLDGLNLGQGRNPSQELPAIVYPPILTLNAGAGGVTLNNSLVLFPSAEGNLQITTSLARGGTTAAPAGSAGETADLTGGLQADKLTGIVMSDGKPTDSSTFVSGPADTSPASDTEPVVLNIAGSINSFGLTVPTFAEISVGGDAQNFGFIGQNSSAKQTTYINVAGKISYTGDLSSVTLAGTVPAALLDPTTSGLPAELLAKLFYDATTGNLTFVGKMSTEEENELLNAFYYSGVDENGLPTGPVPVTLDPNLIGQLYTSSQNATTNDQGLGLYGPGHFAINAGSIDLATSGGIYVNTAPQPSFALPVTTEPGADLTVTTKNDLDMTSSQIANGGWLGNINLVVGGTLNVGGADSVITIGDTYAPKGILTESEGDISVVAHGDVNVNSSRIGAFNGGNVTVESLTGNVNAGTGGTGYVNVDAVQVDPITGDLDIVPTVGIGGSGILATTIPGSDAALGNILVETPEGNIVASKGGILQIPLNGADGSKATAALLAGYLLLDDKGQPAPAAGLSDPADTITLVSPNHNQNVDASGSGIVAQNVVAKAAGEVSGLFVGFNSVNLDANQIGPGVAFGPKVSVTDSGPGESGSAPTIQVISENPVDVNNALVQPSAPQTTSVAKEVATAADNATMAAANSGDSSDETDQKKKKGKPIALAQKVSRVTVLLPQKN